MPRFSRISWKSRDDAEPPRIESRIDAAKRRRSEREIPGAARHTWYCSVSFCWNRSFGAGGVTSGGGTVRASALTALRGGEPPRPTRETPPGLVLAPAGATTVSGAGHAARVAGAG